MTARWHGVAGSDPSCTLLNQNNRKHINLWSLLSAPSSQKLRNNSIIDVAPFEGKQFRTPTDALVMLG